MSSVSILRTLFVVCRIGHGDFVDVIRPLTKLRLYTERPVGCIPPGVKTLVPKLHYHATKLGMFG